MLVVGGVSDSLWRQHCVHTCCRLLWSAPLKSIHCYSSLLSVCVCVSQRVVQNMFWRMLKDTSWGPSDMKTWTMIHHGPPHRNRSVTAICPHLSFHIASTLLYFLYAVVPPPFSLLVCSFAGWPSYCKFWETLMCSDSVRGTREKQNHCRYPVITVSNWIRVIKWMTKHFILVQWVRYSSWGSEWYLWWVSELH